MEYAISERPKNLDSFVGNDTVKSMFQNFFMENNLPHSILFTGSSGTGKTTMVSIIKDYLKVNEAFNLHYVDCGAQKDIATARETVKTVYTNNFGGSSQNVMIVLEEVHRLPKQVQEVWLATLESLKPNQYVLASTDQPEMLIKTFKSRFMEVVLKPLSKELLVSDILIPVVKKYGIKIKRSTLMDVASIADGNNRKALSILTSLSSVEPERHQEVISSFQKEKESQPLYKAVDKLLKYPIYEFYKDYTSVMNVLTSTGLEAEAIRYSIMRQAGNVLKAPSCSAELIRAAFLADVFSNVTCYGELGWASLGLGIYKFFENFYEKAP